MPRLGLKQFDAKTQHFAGIAAFTQSVDVVENELLELESMPEPFRKSLVTNLATLDRYRLLAYGQQLRCASQRWPRRYTPSGRRSARLSCTSTAWS